MRVFYSDYGGDPLRIAKIERVLQDFITQGCTVRRTCLHPISSVAPTLPLPNLTRMGPGRMRAKLSSTVPTEDRVLRYSAAIFRSDHPNWALEACYLSMYLYQLYIEEELERFKPDLVILWHQFSPYHHIIAHWCAAQGVPVVYGEHGVLPGSWCFEFQGQMGESWIARDPQGFQALPLEAADQKQAETYLQQAVSTRMNRKTNMVSVAEAGLDGALREEPRPKILYAGINDFKTGLQPFSQHRSLQHSGDFISTEAGLMALLPLARKNGWRVLFKAHPSIRHDAKALEAYADCLTVIDKQVDLVDLLHYSDALATIVSQSAYMGLLHNVPVVLMGRMQLSGSGLVQEACFRSDLEAALRRALPPEPTHRDPQALRDHVARLIRYYVMSDTYGERGLFRHDLADLASSLLEVCARPEPQHGPLDPPSAASLSA